MESPDPVRIGRYEVVQRLGAGAMGVVYLCQDPNLKRRVAVKVVKPGRGEGEDMIERFRREAEISAQLNHPNIIMVHDVGEDPEAGPFLTMEFVDGRALSRRLEAGPLEPAQALEWLAQLGRALVAAERAGVVHRDIKPENVLVSVDGQIKLTDFGLARDDGSSLTQTGTLMGTPTHTAPELLRGERASPASDRWALAVEAFQMFFGRLPHAGETLSRVLNGIAQEAPDLPQDAPPPLARVFLKALNKDPGKRHPSVLAFLMALAEALGLREQLSVRGLEAPTAAPLPSETEAFEAPAAAVPASAGKPGARLTRPPSDLLRGASGTPAPAAPPSAPASPVASGSRPPRSGPIALAGPGAASSSGRAWQPTRPAASSGLPPAVTLLAVVLALAAAFFLYPHPVEILTEPAGAQVRVDGEEVGPTPAKLRARFGHHLLELRLDGYDTVVREFRPGESPVRVALTPATEWVDLVTDPPGATVHLGGRLLGSTPCKGIRVPDRAQPLTVSLRGHRTWTGVLGPGQKPPKPLALERASLP